MDTPFPCVSGPRVSLSAFPFTVILQISPQTCSLFAHLSTRFQRATSRHQPNPQVAWTLGVPALLASDPSSQFQVPRRESDWLYSANGVPLLGQLSFLAQSAVATRRQGPHCETWLRRTVSFPEQAPDLVLMPPASPTFYLVKPTPLLSLILWLHEPASTPTRRISSSFLGAAGHASMAATTQLLLFPCWGHLSLVSSPEQIKAEWLAEEMK